MLTLEEASLAKMAASMSDSTFLSSTPKEMVESSSTLDYKPQNWSRHNHKKLRQN